MATTGATWRDALGDRRLLVTGFGKWGGGVYDLTSGAVDALDDLATSGMAVGGGRVWRVLRAPGEQTATCELLSYDRHGLRTYQRLDEIRDPHDVCWHDGAVYVTSSWDDAVWRLSGGRPGVVWRGSTVPDGWHVNSLTVAGGALHVCAFGRFDRHKAWKEAECKDVGFVRDLGAGRDVLTRLAHPHTPRRVGDRWYVCESTRGGLTELDAAGTVLRRMAVGRFTRGLAVLGGWALVGGNARRDSEDDDRGEVAVVDLRTGGVVERIALPCLEVYDIVPVPPALARGVAVGFGANAARAVEQHRAGERAAAERPAPERARVRLASPAVAERMAGMGERTPREDGVRCAVRADLATRAVAGTVTSVAVLVANRSGRLLGSAVPRPVKVGARWFRLDPPGDGPAGDGNGGDSTGGGAGDGAEPVANPLVPLPRVLHPGEGVTVHVPLEVPEVPGHYDLRIALRQNGVGWFGVRTEAVVTVAPAGAAVGPPTGTGDGGGELSGPVPAAASGTG